ncbi:Oidioi.mRNA.OKI2018_I69.XSR.g14690.t1.cds [Oikopleura dioica]|uniref:Oidioi.mRNA.OKI2018_I69.XSR.g14690.t1.cds n=1 Tax=Oikopleura dioica TaxID=34765 RepID=A0ABN7SEH2_OIKDI|nr:Oidioi.mRNA.OKI2018_I69.XSR.g14690.t1.cds [Oikopleura dioica]
MSVSMFASSALGSISSELKGNKKETVKSVFSACSSRTHATLHMNQSETCATVGCKLGEDYRLADYYYIKSFCFGSMTDYVVDPRTGRIDEDTYYPLYRYKLYPYVLFACSCLGSCATMLWTISSSKISMHLEYVIDGIEEAVGELMQGIQMTKKFKEATGPCADDKETQTDDGKDEKGEKGYMKIETEDDEEGLLEEIKKIWESDESYEKFHELKKVLLETHANRDDLGTVKTVIFNRIMTLLICALSALIIFYLYVWDVKSIDNRDLSYEWNCRLPPAYHFTDADGHVWETTYCIYTSRASREVLTIILFTLYIILFIGEVCWCLSNIRTWKQCFGLVEFLPFESDFGKSLPSDHFRYGVSDLHLLMSLVQANEASRDKIMLPMKVMSILPPQLQGKAKAETFLSIFLETLVWSATDEGVDDLVKNMPEFHSIYILWTTIINKCSRWDFVRPVEVDYSDFEGIDEPESLSDCYNFYFYHDSGAKMTIAECKDLVNEKLFPTQKTTSTKKTTSTTTTRKTTTTTQKSTASTTTTTKITTTTRSVPSTTQKSIPTTTKFSKFTKLITTRKTTTTVKEIQQPEIRLPVEVETEKTTPKTNKSTTTTKTTSTTTTMTTKRVSRKKPSSHSISSPSPVPPVKDFHEAGVPKDFEPLPGPLDFDFGNLIVVSPVIPKVEAPDENSVVIRTQPAECSLKCGHGGKCVKVDGKEYCECPEGRSFALASPLGKCVKNLKKYCKRGKYSTQSVEGISGEQHTCECGESRRFNLATFTCENRANGQNVRKAARGEIQCACMLLVVGSWTSGYEAASGKGGRSLFGGPGLIAILKLAQKPEAELVCCQKEDATDP